MEVEFGISLIIPAITCIAYFGRSNIIDAEHAAAIQHTQAKEMEDKTRKEHRRHIRHLYTWWHDNYIDYFENGTCALSDDEKKDLV